MAEKNEQTLMDVEILRDFWDADGVRHPAGTVVSIPVEAAMDGAEKGALRRAKKGGAR